MDSELKSLIDRFQQLQKLEVVHRVNERNIIEILNVIHKQKGLVDILYTTDGKEFITKDQLRREIVNEVVANRGRMNIVDLPSALNVDLTYIERALPDVFNEQGSAMVESLGELMTSEYTDALIMDAAEQLKEAGSLNKASFAKTYQLGSQFVSDLLTAAIARRTLLAEQTDTALYTATYVYSQRLALRSALLARATPVWIHDVAVRHAIDMGLLQVLLDQVVPQLPGVVDGGQYTPTIFIQERRAKVQNIYGSNGFATYQSLVAMGITNPKRYMEASFNPPVASVAATTKKRGKRSGAQETDTSQSSTIIRSSSEFPLAGHPLQHGFVSDKLLQSLHALEGGLSNQDDPILLDLADVLPSCVVLDVDGEIVVPRLMELYPVLRDCSLVGASTMIDLDRWWTVATPRFTQAVASEVTKAPSKSTKGDGGDLRKVLADVLRMDPAEQDKLLGDILQRWEDRIDVLRTEARRSVAEQVHSDAKRKRALIQADCVERWSNWNVVMKGIEWAAKEVPTAAPAMERMLAQTVGCSLLKSLIINELLHHSLVPLVLKSETCETLAALRAVVAQVDKQRQAPLIKACDALQGTAEKFTEILESLCSSGELAISCLHPLGKKAEREVGVKLKQQLHTRLADMALSSESVAAANFFALCVEVVVATQCRVVVHIPGKVVSAVCTRLQTELGDSPLAASIASCKEIIVEALTHGSTLPDESVKQLEALRSMVLQDL